MTYYYRDSIVIFTVMNERFEQLVRSIGNCTACHDLPFGTNPVVQLAPAPKILIVGQAPGRKVHDTGIPWNDKSGDTLREWLGVSREDFYNPELFSIMPMGFCYPGKGPSGDLPPRKECAKLWHTQILEHFDKQPELTLLIGQYAQQHYLRERHKGSLTLNIMSFRDFLPHYFVLPHPSPRNGIWLRKNPWFAQEVLPALQQRVQEIL